MLDHPADENCVPLQTFTNGVAYEHHKNPNHHPLRLDQRFALGRNGSALKSHQFHPNEVNALLLTHVFSPHAWPDSYIDLAQQTGRVTIFNKTRRRKQQDAKNRDAQSDIQKGATWLAYRLLGGMRGDPFNSLPDNRDCVPTAIDHLVQVFIPERVLRPFAAVPEIQKLAYDYFQLVISDECVFEASVAQAQASWVVSQGIRKPTKEVLHHNGKALALLQEKLSDPVERLDDAVIHVILAVMGTHFFFMELDQHQAHLDGLWNLIRIRGGIETLGWHGTLRQTVETITSFRAYYTKAETPPATPEVDTNGITPTVELNYPTHPFPTSVTSIITKLPDGFCNIALKCTLSIQMIDLIAGIQEQTLLQRTTSQDFKSHPKYHIYEADKCVEILKSTTMPELERMICGGVLAYVVQSHICPVVLASRGRTTVYDESLHNIMLELAKYIYFKYDNEVLLWVIYCFAALQNHILQDYRSDFFQFNILRFKQSGRWSATETSLKNYLWTDAKLSEWKSNWEQARTQYSGKTPTDTPALTRDTKSPSLGSENTQSPTHGLNIATEAFKVSEDSMCYEEHRD